MLVHRAARLSAPSRPELSREQDGPCVGAFPRDRCLLRVGRALVTSKTTLDCASSD